MFTHFKGCEPTQIQELIIINKALCTRPTGTDSRGTPNRAATHDSPQDQPLQTAAHPLLPLLLLLGAGCCCLLLLLVAAGVLPPLLLVLLGVGVGWGQGPPCAKPRLYTTTSAVTETIYADAGRNGTTRSDHFTCRNANRHATMNQAVV
jgi:hypothetical protein